MTSEGWIALLVTGALGIVAFLLRAIHANMLTPTHLENAVLKMAHELDEKFSQKFYTRREGEQLERRKDG